MTSIGNDIVDLNTINISRTCQPRFYSKILSAAELQLYKAYPHIPFQYFVWLLWSVKESAHKCLQRHQPGLIFAPVKIQVSKIDVPVYIPLPLNHIVENTGFTKGGCLKAKVVYNAETLCARSIIYGAELIHTVVCPQDDFKEVSWGIKKINQPDPESQSAAVRSFLLERLRILIPGKIITIEKSSSRVPFIYLNGYEANAPVSLSHHGDYVGYSVAVS